MTKLTIEKSTSKGYQAALQKLAEEEIILGRHIKGVEQMRSMSEQKNLKLHIGCGPKIKDGWINIDFIAEADVFLDMREPLPFQDNSCSLIYSEHFLEHIDYPGHTNAFLSECFRVLKPEGIFSVGVPDTEWPILEYTGQSKEGYFKIAKERWHPEWCETEMDHLNYHFRDKEEQHKYAYDYKTLEVTLKRAGFIQIERRDFDPELDTEDRKMGTLYANAIKS